MLSRFHLLHHAKLLLGANILFCPPVAAHAQTSTGPSTPLDLSGPYLRADDPATGSADDSQVSIAGTPKRILLDEWHVVTSPARIRTPDLAWLLPLAAASATAFSTDSRVARDVVSHDPNLNARAGTVSDGLRDGFIGVPALLFSVGALAHHDKPREAGLLAGEAIVDAYAFGAATKLITLRERPEVDNGNGSFFQTSAGWDSSFPSGHSLVAWSSAAVLAEEYHKPWQQVTAYALATGVSLTRVMADQHFPSDVLIGSAAGWLIGHYVYRAHHRHTSD